MKKTCMLEVLGEDLKERPSFDRAKAADERGKFHCYPTISPLCIKTNEGFGALPLRVSNPTLATDKFFQMGSPSNLLILKRSGKLQ